MKLFAYAKINLGLRILNRRPDGFHNIESILHYINWYDELTFEPAPVFSFSCSDTRLPVDDQNLVVRAVRRVEAILGFPFPYHVHLNKSIPFGAGLGGGSADAAAVLRFALRQYPTALSGNTIHGIASFLGSDVNFFLSGETQLATDRGIALKPVDFRIPAWILVLFPTIEVPTGWAYQQIRPYDKYDQSLEKIILSNPPLSDYQSLFVNDFDEPIARLKPEISIAKNRLKETGADYISLSGSGSACFALYHEKSRAESAAEILEKDYLLQLTPPGFIPDPASF